MFDNFFGEVEDEYMQRFSTLMFIVFIYYSVTYYLLLRYQLNIINLPSLWVIVALIVFHICQTGYLFQLHAEEKTWLLIAVAFAPVLLFMCWRKYCSRQKQYEQMQFLSQIRQQNNLNAMYKQQQQAVPPEQLPQPRAQPPTYSIAQPSMSSQAFLPSGTAPNLMLNQPPHPNAYAQNIITNPYPDTQPPVPPAANWDTYPGPMSYANPTGPPGYTDPQPFNLSPF